MSSTLARFVTASLVILVLVAGGLGAAKPSACADCSPAVTVMGTGGQEDHAYTDAYLSCQSANCWDACNDVHDTIPACYGVDAVYNNPSNCSVTSVTGDGDAWTAYASGDCECASSGGEPMSFGRSLQWIQHVFPIFRFPAPKTTTPKKIGG